MYGIEWITTAFNGPITKFNNVRVSQNEIKVILSWFLNCCRASFLQEVTKKISVKTRVHKNSTSYRLLNRKKKSCLALIMCHIRSSRWGCWNFRYCPQLSIPRIFCWNSIMFWFVIGINWLILDQCWPG